MIRVILIVQFLMVFQASAGTIFEPSLSLNYGNFEGNVAPDATDPTNVVKTDVTFSSLGLGFRYGITRDYIHVTGVAEVYGIMAEKKDGRGIDIQKQQFIPNFGIGIGYEWNIPLRTYLVLGLPNSSVELSYYFSEDLLVGVKVSRMEMEIAGDDINYMSFGLSLHLPIEFEYPSYWWRKKDYE